MRALQKVKLIFAVNTPEFTSTSTISYRYRQLIALLENAGIGYAKLIGQWHGKEEEAVVATFPKDDAQTEYMLDLAQQFDQDCVCRINVDSSAYIIDMKDGRKEEFKGFFKPVMPWQQDAWLQSEPEGYTYDPITGTYWVVGS